jgi:hypothetical protein
MSNDYEFFITNPTLKQRGKAEGGPRGPHLF